MNETGFRVNGLGGACILEEAYEETPSAGTPSSRPVRRTVNLQADDRGRGCNDLWGGRWRSVPAPDAGPAPGGGSGGTATNLSERSPVTRQAVAEAPRRLLTGWYGPRHASRTRTSLPADEPSSPAPSTSSRNVGSAWDARLQRIKRIAESIERDKSAGVQHQNYETREKERENGGHPAPGLHRESTSLDDVYDAGNHARGTSVVDDATDGITGHRGSDQLPVPERPVVST